MRKTTKENVKKYTKRVAAAAVIFGMLAALLPKEIKEEVSFAAEADNAVTRGVVDSLGQLPHYVDTSKKAAQRGTADHPFVILEIVPYEEYAEFGYLISGCEPVAVEKMYGRADINTIGSLKDAKIEMHTAYFFGDEPESKPENYDGSVDVLNEEGLVFEGYYEYVGAGNGTLKREIQVIETETETEEIKTEETETEETETEETETEESKTEETETEETQTDEAEANELQQHTIVFEKKSATGKTTATEVVFTPSDNGDFIWHTVNDFEKSKYEGNSFNDALDKEVSEAGARIYTKRSSTASAKVTRVYNYYTYENYDHFLTDTLELSKEEADNYSVVIKTITPSELNNAAEWIEYSDLIYLSPKSHVGGLPEIWKKHNRLGKTSAVSAYAVNAFEANDFSWDTTLKLYNKITAKEDFAAIIIDDTIYNLGTGIFTDATVKNVKTTVYDWNLRSTGVESYEFKACSSNIYKLTTMLLCMDAELFKAIYLDADNPVIQNGNNTMQTGNAATYWSVETFMLLQGVTGNLWNYWTSEELWKNYNSTASITDEMHKYWVVNHVFTYKGDTSISQDYITNSLPSGQEGSVFSDFLDYIFGRGQSDANSSDAVRFILSLGSGASDIYPDKIRVLDIEPSVGLALNNEPDWILTKNYIRMLLPKFNGEIEIVHRTTAEFNGKVEDLNSSYEMIFMGLDIGAYNTASQNIQLNNGSWVNLNLPDWNDNSLDGKIYLHTGDVMQSSEMIFSGRTRSVKFLWSVANNVAVDSTELRFPGNDITEKKIQELKEFAQAGYPIVAEGYLYQQEKKLIDENSNIYAFIGEKKGSGVYSTSDVSGILAAVASIKEAVSFIECPALYNGETSGNVIANPNYLPMSSGRSYLYFKFNVAGDGYSYRIFVDQDRNGKFEAAEVVYSNHASDGENSYQYRLANSLVGLIQWKIEVYRTDNDAIRYMKTGCSAAKNNSGTKKEIRVLQIMPKAGNYDGSLNLAESDLFRKYYENLADYDIKIDTITLDVYEDYFAGSNFSYDNSKAAGEDNPKNLSAVDGSLLGYNMMIVGFGDAYGSKNLSNENGAVDYLKYYIDQGKSILFTHDLTSMYNLEYNGSTPFGYTANMTLRDIMGMNRYQAVSNQLTETERNSMIDYQNKNVSNYDTIASEAKHGFTYYAMKRLGWSSNGTGNPNRNNNYKMPYQYMIMNPSGENICNVTDITRNTGFNNNNDITTKAAKLNEGQITVYPYKIDESLTIARTHGQWFQLNLEDEEVTVWYTLADDKTAAAWQGTDSNGDGTGLTYAVSPNDAANNYYIYSKGNVFYSGVGHSSVTGDMEAKLFINTMIAAYRAAYEPPVIEITNQEAVMVSNQNYTMELLQEFNNRNLPGDENQQEAEVFSDEDTCTISFVPIEFNAVSTTLECTIRYEDGSYVEQITGPDGTVLTADVQHKFKGLQNGKEYQLKYKKKYLSEWLDAAGNLQSQRRTLIFDICNDRTAAVNTTMLNMTVQPLFQLD